MADHIDQLLMAPHIMFQRRDIEVPGQNGGAADAVGPVFHAGQKIELLPEFRICLTVRNIAACRYIDIVETYALRGFDIQLGADVARLSIRLPVLDPAVDEPALC